MSTANNPLSTRPVVVYLTRPGRDLLAKLLARERARCEKEIARNAARGWQPAPGPSDMNVVRRAMIEDALAQLSRQT